MSVPAADHPSVYRVVVLGISRQGARRHRLSLTEDALVLSCSSGLRRVAAFWLTAFRGIDDDTKP